MPQNNQTFAFQQGPTYLPLNTGLEKLLHHYGIQIKKSFVLDENCYKQVKPPQFGGGETPIYFAPIIQQENINSDLPFMKSIKGLVAFKVSPIELLDDQIKANNLTATKLFSSSEKSWEMKDRINLDPRLIRPPRTDEANESFALAYLLEGEFQSFFDGKPIPVKTVEQDIEEEKDIEKIGPEDADEQKPEIDPSTVEGKARFVSKGKSAKIFIIASSEMIKNNIIDEEGKGPNATFILNAIDYLNGRDDIAVMRSKEQRLNPLFETDALKKSMIKTFNIAGLPILVALFGLFIWFKRHSRKKQIQIIFQKN
jgi:ABC-type uncharacterized transport system involved in gliding motility auxiliary subunit